MVHIGTVVVHVADVHRAARFWTEALGYELRDGPIGDETPVLIPKHGHGQPIALDDDDRMHFDLHTADEDEQRAEVERLLALGARRVPWTYPPDAAFTVLADTEGNLFCVVNTGKR